VAKELDIPIIALSQLNRSVEMRSGNKRPQLSDLRESGAIEQDADLVIFIHRPEYYGIDVDEEGNSLKGIAEIIVAKHRNGPVGDIQLKFVREYAKFVDLDDTLAMVEDDENGFIVSSKMNHDQTEVPGNNDIGMNNGFDEPAPF
jgi:replicative DNA helicase